MLCFARRTHERLQISDKITLVVLNVVGNQVRFGINAPTEIKLVREKLLERMTQADPKSVDH
jgi:carbon storage regulator